MSEQEKIFDQQLADFTDQMEMGLEVDIDSYHPNVQKLISTVQLTAKGLSVQMPGENTYTRLRNRAFAAYKKEFKQIANLQNDGSPNQLQRLFSKFSVQPILRFSLVATIVIAAIFLLPLLNLDDTGLTGTAGSGKDLAPVLAAIFLIVMFIIWLLNRKSK